MKRFGTGLVVGKFCPLHLGHQFIIDRAFAQCARVVIISYTKPEFDGCPTDRRDRWLEALYPEAIRLVIDDARLRALGLADITLPHNDAPDDVHRAFVAWLLASILRVEVDAVFTSEGYGDGFAASLAVAQGREVAHVSVDPARIAVPISGMFLRGDIHGLRDHLAPVVYRDFVQRVAILGGESSGKSTLAAELALALGTVHAPEYGRELWEARDGALTADDMPHIARTQVEREDAMALDACRYLLCDTTPLTTLFYARELFGHATDELEALAARTYDLVFLCGHDAPFVQDGTRRDAAFRERQNAWYATEFKMRGIPYHVLNGTWDARLATALAVLR